VPSLDTLIWADQPGRREIRSVWRAPPSHGISFGHHPSAREARLHLVPEHVNLKSGLIVDLGANIGEWSDAVLRVIPGARTRR
jgi:hypothetical protein